MSEDEERKNDNRATKERKKESSKKFQIEIYLHQTIRVEISRLADCVVLFATG